MKHIYQLLFLLIISGLSQAVFAQADLSVTAAVNVASRIDLEPLQYTVTLTNAGPNDATGVTVECQIPRGVAFVSSVASLGAYNQNTGVWTLGAVPLGTYTLTINATVNYFNSAYDVRSYADYSVLVKHNGSFIGSAVGGKIGAGNDLSLTGVAVGGSLRTLTTPHNTIVADGYLNFASGTAFKGNVVYGDSTNLPSGSVTYPQGALLQGHPFDFTAYNSNINALSANLSGYPVTGTDTLIADTMTLTGSDIFLNIFSVSGIDFDAAQIININVPKGSAAVINVAGNPINFIGTINVNGNLNNFILFNFYQAASVNIIGSKFEGSILAPLAQVSVTGTLVRGQIFSNHVQSIASHDLHNFLGYVPLNRVITLYANVSASDSLDPNSTPGNGNMAEDDADDASFVVNTTPPFGSTGTGTWQLADTLPNGAMAWSMARYTAGSVLVGAWGGKIYVVDNLGAVDSVINSTMQPVSVIWSLAVSDSGHIYAATSSGLFRSNDAGASWFNVLPNLDVRSILIGLDGNLYAGTWGFGVYKSVNYGYTWTAKNENNGTTVVQTLLDRQIGSNFTLFAGGFLKGISASYNSANSWSDIAFPYDYVLCMDKSSEGILYAGTQLDGVYRSYDNGNTWHKLSGLPDGPVYAVRVDGSNNIFVSVWMNGIYASSSLGDSWTYLGMGGFGVSALFPRPDGSLLIGLKNGSLAVHTGYTGVGKSGALLPLALELQQNYPNPFNPATRIQVAIPVQANYRITVYDVMGREIEQLYNGNLTPGTHSFSFNGSKYASGLYVYTLQGNGVQLTKKMMLLK